MAQAHPSLPRELFQYRQKGAFEMATQAVTRLGVQPNQPTNVITLKGWRFTGLALLRIAFGVVWAIDAWFKWQPDFIQNFTDYFTSALEGQPAVVQWWIHLWHDTVQVNPTAIAYFVALAETAIAIGLLFGLLSNLAYLGGGLMALVIWSTAEGFGGPYVAGTVDIGAAIIYVLVFFALFLTSAGLPWGVDSWLTPRLGRLGFLASGPLRTAETLSVANK